MTATVTATKADTTNARRRLHAAGVVVTYTIVVRPRMSLGRVSGAPCLRWYWRCEPRRA